MSRFEVIPHITRGAEVFDNRVGRPVDYMPSLAAAQAAADALNLAAAGSRKTFQLSPSLAPTHLSPKA